MAFQVFYLRADLSTTLLQPFIFPAGIGEALDTLAARLAEAGLALRVPTGAGYLYPWLERHVLEHEAIVEQARLGPRSGVPGRVLYPTGSGPVPLDDIRYETAPLGLASPEPGTWTLAPAEASPVPVLPPTPPVEGGQLPDARAWLEALAATDPSQALIRVDGLDERTAEVAIVCGLAPGWRYLLHLALDVAETWPGTTSRPDVLGADLARLRAALQANWRGEDPLALPEGQPEGEPTARGDAALGATLKPECLRWRKLVQSYLDSLPADVDPTLEGLADSKALGYDTVRERSSQHRECCFDWRTVKRLRKIPD